MKQEVAGRPVIRFLDPSRVEIVHHVENVKPLRLTLGSNSVLDLGELEAVPRPSDATRDFAEQISDADVVSDAETRAGTIVFKPGLVAGIPITLKARTALSLGLKLTVPRDAKPGETLELHLTQRNREKRIVGGITYHLRVQKPK